MKYFTLQPYYFLLQDHPFHAFLFSKKYTFLHEEKKLHFVKTYAQNVSFFWTAPLIVSDI